MSPIRHSNINTRSLKSPNTPLKASVVILTAVILAACGSSGSGSVTPKPIPMPPGSGTDTGGTGNGMGNNGGSTDNGTGNGGTGTGDNGSGTVTGPDTTEAKKREEEALKAEAAAAKAAAEAAKAEVDAQILANSQTASNAQIEAAKKAAAEAKARAEAAEAAAKDARAKAEAEINKVVADSEARAKAAEEATKAAQAAKTKAEAAAAAAEKAKAEAIKAKEAAEKALEEGGNNDGSAGGNSEALQKEAERKAKLAQEAAVAASAQEAAATKAQAAAVAKESAAAAAAKAASDAANAAKIKNTPEANKTGVQSLNVNGGALGVFSTTTRDFAVSKDGSVVEARADIASQDPKTPGTPGLLPKVSMVTSAANDTDLKDGFKEYKGNAEIVVAALGQTLPLEYVSTYKDFGDDMRIGHIDGGAEVKLLSQTLPVNGVAVMGNATQAANVPTDGTAKYSGDATYRKLGLGNDIEFGKSVFTTDFVNKKVAGDLTFTKAGNIGISATIAGNKFAGSKDGYNTEGGFYGGDAQYLGGVYEGKDAQGTYGATNDSKKQALEAVQSTQVAAQAATKALEAAKSQAAAAQAAAAKAQADAAKAKAEADKAQAAADNAGNGADALQDALDRAAAAEAAQAAAEKAAKVAVDAAKAEAAAAKDAATAAKAEATAKVTAAEKLADQGNAAAAAANKAANEAKARAAAAEAAAKDAETRAKNAVADAKKAADQAAADAKARAEAEARATAAEKATQTAQAAKDKAEAAAAAAEKAKAEAIKAKQDAEKALEDALSSGGGSEALQKEADRKAKLAKEAADTATAQANAATKASAEAAAKESAAAAATKAATDAANAAKIKNVPEATKTGVQSLNVNGGALGVFSTTTRDFAVSKDGSVVEARADIASQDPKTPGKPGLLPKVSMVTSTANDTDLKDGFKEYKGNAEIVVTALNQTLPLDYVSTYKEFGDDMRIGHIDGGAEVKLLNQMLPVNGVAVMGNATQAANVPTDGTAKYSGDATYRKLGLDNDIEFGKSVFTTDFVNKKVAGDLTFAKAGNIGISATIAGNKFAGSKDGYNTEGGFYGGDAQYLGGVYEGKDAQGTYGATSDKQTKAEQNVKTAQTAAQDAAKALAAAKAQATAAQAAAAKAQADAAKAKADADKAQAAAENSGNGADALQDALDRAAAAEDAQAAAEKAAAEAVSAAKAEAAAAKTAADAAKVEADAKVAAAEKLASQGNAAATAANKAANEAKARADAAEATAKSSDARVKAAEAEIKAALEAKTSAEAQAKAAEAATKNAQAATNAAQAAKAKAEAAAAAAEKAKAEAIKAKQDAEKALEDALSSGGSSEALQKEADRKAKLAKDAAAAAVAAATAQTQAAADAAAKATAADAAKTKATQAAAAAKIKNAPETNKTGVQSLNIDAAATLATVFNTTTRDFKVNADGSIVEARADIASQLDPEEPGLLPKVPVTVSGANDANLQNGFKTHTGNAEIFVEALQQTLPLNYVSTYKDFGNDMRIAHIDGAANVELLGATLPVDGVAVLGNATQVANVPKEGSLKYTGDATYRQIGLDNNIEFGKSVFTADFVGKKVAGDLTFAKAGNIGLTANIAGNKFSGTKGNYSTEGGFYGGDAQYLGGVYTSETVQGTYGAISDKQAAAEQAAKTAQTQSQAATQALESAQTQATAAQAALEKAQADAVKAQQAAVKAQEAADNGGGGDALQAALDRAADAEAAAVKAEADATKAVAAAEAAAKKASDAAQAEVKAAQAATVKAQTEAAAAKAAAETAKTEAAAKVAAAQKAAEKDVDTARAEAEAAEQKATAAEKKAAAAELKAKAAEKTIAEAETKAAEAEAKAKAAKDALAAALKVPPLPVNPEVSASKTVSGFQNTIADSDNSSISKNTSASYNRLTVLANDTGSRDFKDPLDLQITNSSDTNFGNGFKKSNLYKIGGTFDNKLNYTSVYKNFDDDMQIGHVYGDLKAVANITRKSKISNVYVQGKATDLKDMQYRKEVAQYSVDNRVNDGKVDYQGVATYIGNGTNDIIGADPIIGTSKFKVDFVDQQVDGTLSFSATPNKKLKAEITGNTFKGNWNGVDTQGGFYGEDASLLGGVYQDGNGKGTYGASKVTPDPIVPVDPIDPVDPEPVDPTIPPVNPTAKVDSNVSGIMSNTLSSKEKKVLGIQATVDRIGYRQFVNDQQTVDGLDGSDSNGGIPNVVKDEDEDNFIDYKTYKPRVDITSPDQFNVANRPNITTVRDNDIDAGNGFKKSASKNSANFTNVQTGVSLEPTAALVLNYDSVYKNFNSQMQIGHVYGDLDKPAGNGKGISSRYSNVYAIGNGTAQADMDYMAALAKFNKANGINDGVFKYAGVATYIEDMHLAALSNPDKAPARAAPVLNGTSAFDVDFVGGKVGGKLNFTGKSQIAIAADITGNTFGGIANGVETAGGFFGEDAKFLGGIYQDRPGTDGSGTKAGTGTKFQGTFGAEKVTK